MDKLEKILKDKLQHYQIREAVPSWAEMERALNESALKSSSRRSRILLWTRWSAAAVLLLVIGIGIFQYDGRNQPKEGLSENAKIVSEKIPDLLQVPAEPVHPEKSPGLFSAEREIPVISAISTEPSPEENSESVTLAYEENPVQEPSLQEEVSSSVVSSEKTASVSPEDRRSLTDPFEVQASSVIAPRKLWAVSLFAGPNLEQSPSGMMVKTGLVMNTPVSGQYPVFAEYNKTVRTPEINESLLDHKMPVSIGFSLRRYLTDRFSVDAGLLYSYMRSESSLSGTNNDYRYRQDLHYLGIPVSFSLDVLQAKLFRVYISGGGMGEVALSAKGQIDLYSGDSKISAETVHLNAKGIVWSVHGTAGMEYRILRHTGIYLEPGFSYYPENLHQPSSFRTERPFIFDFRLGLRKEF